MQKMRQSKNYSRDDVGVQLQASVSRPSRCETRPRRNRGLPPAWLKSAVAPHTGCQAVATVDVLAFSRLHEVREGSRTNLWTLPAAGDPIAPNLWTLPAAPAHTTPRRSCSIRLTGSPESQFVESQSHCCWDHSEIFLSICSKSVKMIG